MCVGEKDWNGWFKSKFLPHCISEWARGWAVLHCSVFLHLFCFEDPKSAQETNESLTGGGLVGKQSQAFLSHAANVSVCEVWQTVHALGG